MSVDREILTSIVVSANERESFLFSTRFRMSGIYISECAFGRGVFAGRPFATGEEILTFEGPLITLTEALALGQQQANVLQIGDELYIDIGPPAVLANHSCDPNAGIRDDTRLVALRPIRVDEQIVYDYSTTMWEGIWSMHCGCGSPRCRNVVDDFPTLPPSIQAEYLRQNVVQRFIRNRLSNASAPGPDQ